MDNQTVRLLLSPAEAIFLGAMLDEMNGQLMEHYAELDQDQRMFLDMAQTIRKYLPQAEAPK